MSNCCGRRPLVSILTPSFNQGQFLEDCITSVALQTYEPIEHIIYDGASRDETLGVLRRHPASNGLKWASEPDRGQAHALNKALSASRGAIIGWLNSDDAYALRSSVATAVEMFASSDNIDVVFGDALLVDAFGLVLHVLKAHQFNYELLRMGCFIYQPALFVRRDVLLKHGFLNESFQMAMDYELWMRLAESGVRFVHVDKPLAIDRHHRDRKVEKAKPDLKREVALIRPEPSTLAKIRWRSVNVMLRLRGCLMVPRVYRRDLMPFLHLSAPTTMMLRQALVPRRLYR